MVRHGAASWIRAVATTAMLALAVGACTTGGATAAPPTSTGGTGGNGGGGTGAVTFTVQVDFTGAYDVHGSFTDVSTGSGWASCAEYASSAPAAIGWIGPSTPSNSTGEVDGKTVSYLISVFAANFKGPGTYTDQGSARIFAGLEINNEAFNGSGGSVTDNADGSGKASFNDYKPLGSSTTNESGTTSWTCAG